MNKKVEEILEVLKNEEVKKKQEILLECATKIGTQEWVDAVKDLSRRMEDLNKPKK